MNPVLGATKFSRFTRVAGLLVFLAATAAHAQFQAPGISASLLRLFTDLPNCSGQVELRVLDSAGTETLFLPAHLSHEPGKLRLEFDLAQVKGGLLPEFALESLTQVGLHRVATVLDPAKKIILMLYPFVRSYTEMPMPAEEVAVAQRKYTIVRKEAGRESIDGHDCAKNIVTYTDDAGRQSEATFWLAADFQGLPAQIETREKSGTQQLRFKWLRRVTANSRRFAVPDGYKKYPSSTALVKAAVDQAVAEQKEDAPEKPQPPEKK